MATATEKKTPCSTCQKASGVFTCRGCVKDFCSRHVSEHRQELSKQMDEVTTNHDQLQQTIDDLEAKPAFHPLMKKIDEWEQESINKILQAADDARKNLLPILSRYRTQVTNDLTSLTTELSKARNEDDYVETDLKEWTEKLDALKIDLNAAQIIDFGQDTDESSLIPKFYINDPSIDIFHQTAGNITIMEGGRAIVHGPTNEIAAARCRDEYSSGQHRFRFKIEQLSSDDGFSCGIVSKNTPVGSIFITQANHNMYVCYYGGSDTYQRLNHNVVPSFHNQNYNFVINDIYELLIDCNQQRMHLTNERTRYTQQLDVNLSTYPFPWQFFITLLCANDRVCLC